MHFRHPRTATTGAAAIVLVTATFLVGAPASAATGAQLSVLHAVPGLTVDVWVNGERTLDDFTPGSMAGPLDLAPGTYTVAITAADAVDASAPAIGPVDLPLESGKDYTAVAHLDASGTPTATLFTNDTAATPAGHGRLTVRHVAAAPAVDVLVGGTAVIAGLANPQEKVLDLPAGTISASVAAAGTTDAVLGPVDIPVADGVNTIVYAWGSLSDDTLAAATQTVQTMSTAPSGVQAGHGGLAATDTGASSTPWLVVTGALALVALLTVTIVRGRNGTRMPSSTGHGGA